MNDEDVRDFLKGRLAAYRDVVPADELDEIRKFLHHDEYEMAFEGLALDLMRLNVRPDEEEAAGWLRYAAILRLDTESVLDPEFSNKLRRWTGQ